MHEVADDPDLHAAGLGLLVDPVDLVLVAVDERGPRALVGGVAALGLVEDLADDGRGVIDDAGCHPLAGGDRPGNGGLALGVVGGQHVSRGAYDRGGVIDGANLRHPLAPSLLALGQPGLQLGSRLLGLPAGLLAQRAREHHHPLPVAREHQHAPGLPAGASALGVEALEVDRRAARQLLDLALAEPLGARARHGRDRVIVRAARRLDSAHPPQPVRVLLDWQVQRAVGRTEIPVRLRAVRDPAERSG